jgi:hypothetical protein
MVFSYNEVTISGGNAGIVGASSVLDAVADTMVAAGWVIDDDRRSQAGSSVLANTHKIVLRNEGGESGTSPNIYVTLTSGNSAAQNAATVGMQVSGAYDNVSHTVPASGVKNPNTTTLSQLRTFSVDADGYNRLWIAADKDQVALVNNHSGSVTPVVFLGRIHKYLDDELEPYGAIVFSPGSMTPVSNNALGIVGNNPPETITTSSDGDTVTIALTSAQEPRQGLGNQEAIFTANPILWTVDDASPVRKGVIGQIRHVWAGANQNAGLPPFGTAVVSGTGQEFAVFGGSTTLFLRKN